MFEDEIPTLNQMVKELNLCYIMSISTFYSIMTEAPIIKKLIVGILIIETNNFFIIVPPP